MLQLCFQLAAIQSKEQGNKKQYFTDVIKRYFSSYICSNYCSTDY